MHTRLIRRPEVQFRTGLSRSRIYEEMSQGRFPKPVKTGRRAVAWVETEVDAWVESIIADSRNIA